MELERVLTTFRCSRSQLFEWQARYRAEGVAGLEPRSRRPLSSPRRTPVEVEDAVLVIAKARPRWGPDKIRAELVRTAGAAPARSTIQQILARRTGSPRRRVRDQAKPAWRRFVRPHSNDLWQIDATRPRVGRRDRLLGGRRAGRPLPVPARRDRGHRPDRRAGLVRAAGRRRGLRAAAPAALGQRHHLHRAAAGHRGQLRTLGPRRRDRADPRRAGPPPDPGQARTPAPHPERMGHRPPPQHRGQRPAGPRRLPGRLQPAPPAPGPGRGDDPARSTNPTPASNCPPWTCPSRPLRYLPAAGPAR